MKCNQQNVHLSSQNEGNQCSINSFISQNPKLNCKKISKKSLINNKNIMHQNSFNQNYQLEQIARLFPKTKYHMIKKANLNKTPLNHQMMKDINFMNSYSCMQKAPQFNKHSRVPFSEYEDENIKFLVNKYGTRNWSLVASFIPGRTPKQCRDRYANYLVPGYFQGEWSKEEDNLLIKLFKENGSKWSTIQKYFPMRSSNSIKNRWYYFLRKADSNDQIEQKNDDDEYNEKSEDDQKLIIKEEEITNSIPECSQCFDENAAENNVQNDELHGQENDFFFNFNDNNMISSDNDWEMFL